MDSPILMIGNYMHVKFDRKLAPSMVTETIFEWPLEIVAAWQMPNTTNSLLMPKTIDMG